MDASGIIAGNASEEVDDTRPLDIVARGSVDVVLDGPVGNTLR